MISKVTYRAYKVGLTGLTRTDSEATKTFAS